MDLFNFNKTRKIEGKEKTNTCLQTLIITTEVSKQREVKIKFKCSQFFEDSTPCKNPFP